MHAKSREKRKEFENEDKNNQRVPKANLWIINYCILKMKAGIMNLQLVHRYILSLSKNENMVFEKTKNQKDQKQTEKKFSMARNETRTSVVEGLRPLSIAPGQLTSKTRIKLIIYTTFAHEVLPIDAV